MRKVVLENDRYRDSVKNWWVSLVLGIIFFIVGIFVFFRPGESYLALAVTFGIIVLISGILEIYQGSNTPAREGKGWLVAAGIIELLLGILMLSVPGILIMIMPFLLGFWLMFRGFTTIGVASDMIGYGVRGAGWTLAIAILVVICSFFILADPLFGIGAIVLWLGLSLVLAGIGLMVHAGHLHMLRKYFHTV